MNCGKPIEFMRSRQPNCGAILACHGPATPFSTLFHGVNSLWINNLAIPDHVDNGRLTKPVASARLAVGRRHLSPDAVVDKQSNPQMFVDEFGAVVAWSRDVGMM